LDYGIAGAGIQTFEEIVLIGLKRSEKHNVYSYAFSI